MRIIINEMKKIFSLKMVCLLIIGSAIFYQMFISFEIETFPNGRPALDVYNIMAQMIEDYGNEMDETELQQFKNVYKEKLEEADELLSNNKDFNGVGVYSYEDYQNTSEKSFFEETNEKFDEVMWDYLLNREEGTVFWELQEFPNIIELYEERDDYSDSIDGKKYEERINDINENNENESILTRVVFYNYNNIIRYLGLCIVLGIAFMLTPLFLKDKMSKVEYLQQSSKHGRRLFKSKLIAGLISALIITTLELIICFILYSGNNTSMFFGSNINSVFNFSFWFSLTFIQYIIITVISIYIISIIAAFITMFISSQVNSYIAGIGTQVPALFIIGGATLGVLLNNLFAMYMPKYLFLVIYIILIVITCILVMRIFRKEKIRDILN